MTSVFSKSLQIYSAEQFKKSIDSIDDPYVYFTFGKVDPWPNDNSPPQPNTSIDTYNDVWKNMIGAKVLLGSDVRLGIRRNDWTYDTPYHAYDDCSCSMDMNDANIKYFVVTDEWNVYKCIANNNGANSTTKPDSLITTQSIKYSDNYIWKYMYTLTDEERLRFVTDKFIPVRTLREDNGSLQWQVQNAATSGAIETIRITNPGSGYTNGSVVITGDGFDAEATLAVNVSTSGVDYITMIDRGRGYTTANVTIVSSSGQGATARAIISPPGGHGSDPVEELGGSHVIINAKLRNTEAGILDIQNEFRQVALIKNPIQFSSSNQASNLVYSQTIALTLSSEQAGDYEKDEIAFQGATPETASFKGRVASWTRSNNRLELIDTYGTAKTDIITGNSSRVAKYVVSPPRERGLKPYTGELLYVDYIEPIQRDIEQTEDFKIVISF